MPSIETRHRARSARKDQGYAAVFATVLIWSTPSLFQFYLNRFYDPFAQNFYRYSDRVPCHPAARSPSLSREWAAP